MVHQLTVPCDRSQVTYHSKATTREDYLIQGMPTALINHGAQVQSAISSSTMNTNLASNVPKAYDHSID